jgi:hypothetical protein
VQQIGTSSASTTLAEVCRNHDWAESLKRCIKKKSCQTFVQDETPEPMSGIVLRSKGLTLPRWILLDRNHNREELAGNLAELEAHHRAMHEILNRLSVRAPIIEN